MLSRPRSRAWSDPGASDRTKFRRLQVQHQRRKRPEQRPEHADDVTDKHGEQGYGGRGGGDHDVDDSLAAIRHQHAVDLADLQYLNLDLSWDLQDAVAREREQAARARHYRAQLRRAGQQLRLARAAVAGRVLATLTRVQEIMDRLQPDLEALWRRQQDDLLLPPPPPSRPHNASGSVDVPPPLHWQQRHLSTISATPAQHTTLAGELGDCNAWSFSQAASCRWSASLQTDGGKHHRTKGTSRQLSTSLAAQLFSRRLDHYCHEHQYGSAAAEAVTLTSAPPSPRAGDEQAHSEAALQEQDDEAHYQRKRSEDSGTSDTYYSGSSLASLPLHGGLGGSKPAQPQNQVAHQGRPPDSLLGHISSNRLTDLVEGDGAAPASGRLVECLARVVMAIDEAQSERQSRGLPPFDFDLRAGPDGSVLIEQQKHMSMSTTGPGRAAVWSWLAGVAASSLQLALCLVLFILLNVLVAVKDEWRCGNVSHLKRHEIMSWRTDLIGWDVLDWIRYRATIWLDAHGELSV